MRANFTIGQRLGLLIVLFCAILIVGGGIGFFSTKRLSEDVLKVTSVSLPETREISMLSNDLQALRADVFRAVIAISRSDVDELSESKKDFDTHLLRFQEHLDGLKKIDSKDLSEFLEKTIPVGEGLVKKTEAMMALALNGNLAGLNDSLPMFIVSFDKLEEQFVELQDNIKTRTEAIQKSSRSTSKKAMTLVAIVVGVGLIFGILNGLWLARKIVKDLRTIMSQLMAEAQHLDESSTSISVASQKLSEAATQQSASIEETVSSMEEMTSMLSQTTKHSEFSLAVSEKGTAEAQNAERVLHEMVRAMEQIEASNERLQHISKLIVEIGDKTKVINNIVFETRLLAFNASIEAARAGVHGKGFAVVAEEVGKLATMSGEAANDIRHLLESSISQVTNIVEETRGRVALGKSVTAECSKAFEVTKDRLAEIGSTVRMISSATQEQEAGVKQTHQAMSELDRVTQINTKSSIVLATQSNDLETSAKSLTNTIDRLRNLIERSNKSANFSRIETQNNAVLTAEKPSGRVSVEESDLDAKAS